VHKSNNLGDDARIIQGQAKSFTQSIWDCSFKLEELESIDTVNWNMAALELSFKSSKHKGDIN
jgi:hypothetical protein